MKSTLVMMVVVATSSFAFQEGDRPPVVPKTEAGQQEGSKEGRVSELVRKLGSSSAKEREAAYDELKGLGAKILPILEKHRSHPDLEVRMRIRSLLDASKKTTNPPTPGAREGQSRLKPVDPSSEPTGPDRGVGPRGGARGARPLRRDFNNMETYMRALRKWMESDRRVEEDSDSSSSFSFSFGGGPGFASSVSMSWGGESISLRRNGRGVKFTVRNPRNRDQGGGGTFEARDMEEFRRKHPAVYEKYKASGIFENKGGLNFRVFGPDDRKRDPDDPFADGFERQIREMQEMLEKSLRDLGVGPISPDTQGQLIEPLVPVERPRLGVVVEPLPSSFADQVDPEKLGARGVRVSEVIKGSLAETMGFRPDDVIYGFGDAPINHPDDLVRLVKALKDGEKIRAKIIRAGEEHVLEGVMGGKKPVPVPRKRKKI